MNTLLNFYQNTKNVSSSGQPQKEQFVEIAADGYSTIINLAMPDSDNAIPEEANIVTSFGMSYIHIPVPFEAPQAKHLKQFFGIMDGLQDEKVLVHCVVNARVSAFMHQYLTLKKGYSSKDASSPVLEKWRPDMDKAWQDFMQLQLKDIE